MPLSAVTDAGEHMHSELVTSVQRDIENVCQVPMMPGLKKKSRLVIFRVPEEDYVALTKWCTASGARSISEFVRLAVVEKVQTLGSRRVTFSARQDAGRSGRFASGSKQEHQPAVGPRRDRCNR